MERCGVLLAQFCNSLLMIMALQNQRPLNLNDAFPCPVCRQGNIEPMVLTEAFACSFCRHILAADLPLQQVQVIDSSQALTWKWQGQRWQLTHTNRVNEISLTVILTAVALTLLPAGLVWLSGALFPPLEPSPKMTFSTIWAGITFFSHLSLVLWLLGEYYQVPFYIATKVRLFQLQSALRP